MPWNEDLDQFGSPNFDSVPFGFIAENIIDLYLAEQARIQAWWNNKWASRMKCSLQPITKEQCFIGFPTTNNTRALHIFNTSDSNDRDNTKTETIKLGICYTTGQTQGASTEAGRFYNFKVSSFYLVSLQSFFETLPLQKIFGDWPNEDGSEPPTARRFANDILDPSAKFPDLIGLGVQAYLGLEIQIQPNPIYLDQP